MPSEYQISLPIPPDYSEYENIVKEYLKDRFQKEFSKFGRQGQKQYGIDVFCSDGIVVQCKNYTASKLTKKILEQDISNAEKHFPFITQFIIATTAEPDATIQDYILNRKQNFVIEICYWSNIVSFLLKNPEIRDLFYPKMNMLDDTEVFVNNFLDLCHKYSLYSHIKENDFNSVYPADLFFALDACKNELYTMLYESNIRNVGKEVSKDICSFYKGLKDLVSVLANTSTTIDGIRSVPCSSLLSEEKKRQRLLDDRQEMIQIYSKYQFK